MLTEGATGCSVGVGLGFVECVETTGLSGDLLLFSSSWLFESYGWGETSACISLVLGSQFKLSDEDTYSMDCSRML